MLVSLLKKMALSEPYSSFSNVNYILIVSTFHSSLQKQVLLATTNFSVVGGDSVCCGYGVIALNPRTVQITLEDSEDWKRQQS